VTDRTDGGAPNVPATGSGGEARFHRLADALRRSLLEPLPGRAATTRLAPAGRAGTTPDQALADGAARAGALLLVYPIGPRAEPHVALTERTGELRAHAGQVSLPGGRLEADETPRQAALREADEELAVAPSEVEVLGELSALYIPPSDFVVFPVVAVAGARPAFQPNPAEVAALIEAPVAAFVGDLNVRTETWRLPAGSRRVPHYRVGGHTVWGATAMVLAEFGVVWARALRHLAEPERGAATGRPRGAAKGRPRATTKRSTGSTTTGRTPGTTSARRRNAPRRGKDNDRGTAR